MLGNDQIWPVDLCKDSSVAHQWRPCEAEHWAFSFSTSTSGRCWVMSHVPHRAAHHPECEEFKVDLLCKILCALSFRKQKTTITSRQLSLRHLTKCPCLCVLLDFTDTWDCFRRTEKETLHDSLSNFLAPLKGLRVCREDLCLTDRLPSIMNNLLTIRGCCQTLLCCHVPQPEKLSLHPTRNSQSERGVLLCFTSRMVPS